MSSSSRHNMKRPTARPGGSSRDDASASSSRNYHSNHSFWQTVMNSETGQGTPHSRTGALRPQSSMPPLPRQSPKECMGCRRSFPTTRSFEEHLRSCPGNVDKPYPCEQCGTAFKKNSNLVKHMKLVHLGERNFPCPEPGCGRLFGQKSNLNSHIKAVHRGEKPFVCSEADCGRRFSQKSGLKAHVKTVHNGERPYQCECGSSFGHRGDVSNHFSLIDIH